MIHSRARSNDLASSNEHPCSDRIVVISMFVGHVAEKQKMSTQQPILRLFSHMIPPFPDLSCAFLLSFGGVFLCSLVFSNCCLFPFAFIPGYPLITVLPTRTHEPRYCLHIFEALSAFSHCGNVRSSSSSSPPTAHRQTSCISQELCWSQSARSEGPEPVV